MRAKIFTTVLILALACVSYAGGPLFIYDADNQIPFAWNGTVQVYTDLGALGGMSNEQANGAVAFAIGQWNAVPTSSFHAEVAGNVGALGLSDITAANAAEVLGAYNGGGIHIIYDSDGTVLADVLGVGYGVLGVASPEWSEDDSPVIVEGWVVINGDGIPDPATISWVDVIAEYTGVITHEFGHAINLAHSQTNGAVLFIGLDVEQPVPGACDLSAIGYTYPSVNDVETMYPFINPGWSGTAQSTVDVLDDIVSLSNIYPAEGWPSSHGSVAGTITMSDGSTPVLGANVIARNVANPYTDAVSAMSGDYTQGVNGTDGRFVLNGLTPGADYVLYVDGIVAGGFSTPYGLLPGPEEYWNDALESGDATTDASCDFVPITATAATVDSANIALNANPDAPVFTPLELPNSIITDISQQGDEIVGGMWGGYVGFKWTKNRGYEFFPTQMSPVISGNGQKVGATEYPGWPELSWAAYWDGGSDPTTMDDDSWMRLETLPGSQGCDASLTSIWDISRDGNVAVGHNWFNCTDVQAFRWDPRTGTVQLPKALASSRNTRANAVSGDGRVVAGHEESDIGWWAGVVWRDGVPEIIEQEADWWGMFDVFPVGDAWDINQDGSVIVGENAIGSAEDGYPPSAWMWTEDRGLEVLGFIPCPPWSWFCWSGSGSANAVSDDGRVVVGWGGDYEAREATIWTRGLGLMTLEDFLQAQNVVAIEGWDLMTALALSGDGRIVGGWGGAGGRYYGWTVNIDKVEICHKGRTIKVAFPSSSETHLAHGDTFGACAQ